MKKTQVVMTADLARYLMKQGFHIIDLNKNRKDPKSSTFVFSYSEQLQQAMDIYFEEKRKSREPA